MKTIACAAAVFLLIAGPALADDKLAPPKNEFAPPPLTPQKQSRHHDWTGFYVGGQTGLSAGNADSKWTSNGASRSPSFSSTSPTFGAHAGYNYQFGQGVVLGGESDVSPK
jgi:outer membrane immunogenic protein